MKRASVGEAVGFRLFDRECGADDHADGHVSFFEVEELTDGDELVAFGEQLVESGRHGFDGGGVNIMGEHDGSRMSAIDEAAGDDGDARSAPVLRVHRPHDGGVAELGKHELFDASIDGTIRWADEMRAVVCRRDEGVFTHLQFAADLCV